MEALLLPGPCTPRRRPARCQPAAPPEPCVPRQPPRVPERPCTARRQRLRLLMAGIELGGSGSVARAAVPPAPESRSRLFSVEKTGNFARLRQASKLLRASRADGTPCHAENGRNCQFSRAGGVPKLVCFGQQERPISSTASSCTTQYRRLIPSAFANKKPDLANL